MSEITNSAIKHGSAPVNSIRDAFKQGVVISIALGRGELQLATYIDQNDTGILVEGDDDAIEFFPWARIGRIYFNDTHHGRGEFVDLSQE